MTEEQRYNSLRTNKLHLPFLDRAVHFLVVHFLLMISLAALFIIAYIYIGTRSGKLVLYNKDAYNIPSWVALVSVILAFPAYRLQANRLKFKEVHTTLTRDQIVDIIEKVGEKLKWHPDEVAANFIIAKTFRFFPFRFFFWEVWGEQITILFDSNRILINSISRKGSLVSYGHNKKNVNRLVEEIEKASR